MNILSLVSIFLLLFAFLTASISEDSYAFQRICSFEQRELRLVKKTHRKIQHTTFEKLVKKDPVKSSKQKKDPFSTAKIARCKSCSKCNLHLIKKQVDSPFKKVAKKLLRMQIKTLSFIEDTSTINRLTEEIFQKVLEELEKSSVKHPLHLEKIYFKDPILRRIYYLALKGDEGSSLLRYWHTSAHMPYICLPCADETLLSALFGKNVAKALMRRKNFPEERLQISKEDLITLLHQHGEKVDEEVLSRLSFRHKQTKSSSLQIAVEEGGKSLRTELPKYSS